MLYKFLWYANTYNYFILLSYLSFYFTYTVLVLLAIGLLYLLDSFYDYVFEVVVLVVTSD